MDISPRPPEGTGRLLLSSSETAFLLRLQRQALAYFLDNQTRVGLFLDRQSNHGPRRLHGLCSTATSGMGFIALALASFEPYCLLPRSEAVRRVRSGLETALERLPHDHGILPHFVHSATGQPSGCDRCSTIDSAWLFAGGLWAAAFLDDRTLRTLASQLFERVDWSYWMGPDRPGLIRHGKDRRGRFLPCSWDRLNGETIFLYILAAGADSVRAWPADAWSALGDFVSETAGHRFRSADLGLFVHQYSHDLLDLAAWRTPQEAALAEDAGLAAVANERFCRQAAERFCTYRTYWGLSAGDGPGESDGDCDVYRCYAPTGIPDGTAQLTVAATSLAHHPAAVWELLFTADRDRTLAPRGRYGFSAINLDRIWVARDMVGLDAGALILALDNCLADNRVRRTFHALPTVENGLNRIGFRCRAVLPQLAPAVRTGS